MASPQCVFGSVFLCPSAIHSLQGKRGPLTQLAAIGKCFLTVFALERFVAPVTSLVTNQGRLPSKGLATDRAPEVFI